uniref:Saposin B-type domain-containing protein n=1 Tax=Panagrellus redivivus TaxID=6233 RepID=A0A7E4W0V6_PANRE
MFVASITAIKCLHDFLSKPRPRQGCHYCVYVKLEWMTAQICHSLKTPFDFYGVPVTKMNECTAGPNNTVAMMCDTPLCNLPCVPAISS